MNEISAVLVHYHTPELATESVRALRRDAEASGLDLTVLIVDNGSSAAGRRILQDSSADRLIASGRNRGYAGGVNLGLRSVETPFALVLNPDVLVEPGCLATLATELDAGTAAAGPRFYLDPAKTYLLPPTERTDRLTMLGAGLANRGESLARWARVRWRTHARRHWEATDSLVSWDLSGALLAFRMDAWRRVGPFDEGFQLYFEETDWLRRLRSANLVAKLVPAAEAIHAYAQSSRQEERAQEWFESSATRFRRKYYGWVFRRLLSLSTTSVPSALEPARPLTADLSESWARTQWVEISESVLGFPAAGRRISKSERAQSSQLRAVSELALEHDYQLTLVGANGEELASGRPAQKRSLSPLV